MSATAMKTGHTLANAWRIASSLPPPGATLRRCACEEIDHTGTVNLKTPKSVIARRTDSASGRPSLAREKIVSPGSADADRVMTDEDVR
jgi:hypothetical protein